MSSANEGDGTMRTARNIAFVLALGFGLSSTGRAEDTCPNSFQGPGSCETMQSFIYDVTQGAANTCEEYCEWLPSYFGCQAEQVDYCFQHGDDNYCDDSNHPD